MKKLIVLFTIIVAVFSAEVKAQNSQFPWMLNFGLSAPHMSIRDQKFYKEYFNVQNWNVVPSFHVKASRHIIGGLSPQTTFSFGFANRKPSTYTNSYAFVDWDVNLKYSFANGYILKEKCWFDPYFVVGAGLNYFEQNPKSQRVSGDVDAGAGINFWVSKNISLFFQSTYNYVLPKRDNPAGAYRDYVHHTMGIGVRFGKGKDTDKDGIADKDDKCPTVAGLAAFAGCPDTDGDGVEDALDKCPTVAGLAVFAGCPDTDGDGIEDALDKCPREKGPKETKGCPDRDGDFVADKDDACPDVSGRAMYKGCPDTDGDGVSDDKDLCPNEPGLVDNNGCPKKEEKIKQIEQQLNIAAKNIEFETNSAVIRQQSYADIDNIIRILEQNPNYKVKISGHTDNVGSDSKNVTLSLNRATAVFDYINNTRKINISRLLPPAGYGPYVPIDTNATPEGRQHNRRVEFKIVE